MIGIFTLFNYQVSENLDEAFKKIINEHKLIKIEYSRNFFIITSARKPTTLVVGGIAG